MRTGWAILGFTLASAVVYVVNDLADRERDRLHPVKRHRPIASGRVSPAAATPCTATGLRPWTPAGLRPRPPPWPADAGRAGGMGGVGGARAERPRPQTPDARGALTEGPDRTHPSNTGRPRPSGARGTARPAPTGPHPKKQPGPGAQPRFRGAGNCATSPRRPAPEDAPLPPNRRRPTPTWGAGL
ncbi:UbiA family prenyltransferase [Streptomyces sp. NPDC057927]